MNSLLILSLLVFVTILVLNFLLDIGEHMMISTGVVHVIAVKSFIFTSLLSSYNYQIKILILQKQFIMIPSHKKTLTETKPINQIMSLKSNDDLIGYLQQRPQINLSIMRQKNQTTLLHFAAFKNQIPKMKIYIKHFQAYVRQNQGKSRNQASFEMQLKAWINVQNSQGFSALHFAGLHGNVQMMRLLEELGANMMIQSDQKQNVLFMCAQKNQLKAAIYLIQNREFKLQYDVNTKNSIGDTIFHKVAKGGYLNFSAYLLSRSELVEIDAKNNDGWTPLMYATSSGHKQVVKRMLMKGVDRSIKNNDGNSAIKIARQDHRQELVKTLNDNFSSWQNCQIACNFKIVYKVEEPTKSYMVIFLILFHIFFLFPNLVCEVNFLGDDKFYLFYILVGLYYLVIMILYCLLVKKHQQKQPRNLMQIDLPFCPQCRSSYTETDYHCFICKNVYIAMIITVLGQIIVQESITQVNFLCFFF